MHYISFIFQKVFDSIWLMFNGYLGSVNPEHTVHLTCQHSSTRKSLKRWILDISISDDLIPLLVYNYGVSDRWSRYFINQAFITASAELLSYCCMPAIRSSLALLVSNSVGGCYSKERVLAGIFFACWLYQ